jgi:hypothetical protein
MNRRHFVVSGVLSGLALSIGKVAKAQTLATPSESCDLRMDYVTAEATYFSRYEHFHILAIPISVLAAPKPEGYKVRTSPLDQASLDEKAFEDFIKESGLDGASLRKHSHEVTITKEELERIASGEKNVKITVPTPKGNLAHHFFFTASRSALIKIQRQRAGKKA